MKNRTDTAAKQLDNAIIISRISHYLEFVKAQSNQLLLDDDYNYGAYDAYTDMCDRIQAILDGEDI